MNIFFDLETTSLDTDRCQISQLAVVDAAGVCLMAATYGIAFEVLETKEIQLAGLAYNGYNLDYAETLPIFSERDLRQLVLLFEGSTCWAHNVRYDKAVLEATALRFGLGGLFASTAWDCTMELATPGRRSKLPNLSLESSAHDALSDTLNCWRLWKRHQGVEPGFEPKWSV